jgi:hypothetical protein
VLATTAIFSVDRKKPFNPAESIDNGWTIVDEDERSLALSEIDFSKIRLETCLTSGEWSITGEEKLRRLKMTRYIRLDAKVCQTLRENQHLIPGDWKVSANSGVKFVFFDGTILRDPHGHRCIVCLYWDVREWRLYPRRLNLFWDAGRPSAVLAS